MKQILLATTNPGKIASFKKILARLGYEGLSFADLDLDLEEPEETQLTAEDIAAEKALGYAKQYKALPVLARDDTCDLLGVSEEDDPKNHNKAFVIARKGRYTDDLGAETFAEVASKYNGEVPCRFNWGFGLAWHEGDEIKVVHTMVSTDPKDIKLVDKISSVRVPGFCLAPVLKINIDGEWKYDSELSDGDYWKAYWDIQSEGIKSLLEQLR